MKQAQTHEAWRATCLNRLNSRLGRPIFLRAMANGRENDHVIWGGGGTCYSVSPPKRLLEASENWCPFPLRVSGSSQGVAAQGTKTYHRRGGAEHEFLRGRCAALHYVQVASFIAQTKDYAEAVPEPRGEGILIFR